MLFAALRAMRPYQWTKNLLVFAALVFSQRAADTSLIAISVLAFAAFCLLSSAMYVFNDLMDMEQDRAHPKKRCRPLASGALPVPAGWVITLVLFAAGILLGGWIGLPFLAVLLVYAGLTMAYSLGLKHVAIIDVMTVALGFVLRAMAGALALDVAFSNWLVVCTLFLALFLAISKRRHELTLLDEDAGGHRAVLDHYSVAYLDQLILIVAGGTIITYTIYTCSPEVVMRLETDKLYLTLPFVVYGLFRYLHLIHHGEGGGDPSSTLLRDWPMAVTVVLWGLACVCLIYVFDL